MGLTWRTELLRDLWRIFIFCIEWFCSWERGSSFPSLLKLNIVTRYNCVWVGGTEQQGPMDLACPWHLQGIPAAMARGRRSGREGERASCGCLLPWATKIHDPTKYVLHTFPWYLTIIDRFVRSRGVRSWFVFKPSTPCCQMRDTACVDSRFLPTSLYVFFSSQMALMIGFSD